MPTELPIPSGPTNREIIDRAYQVLGLSDSMFARTPEEYASAVLSLGAMMLEWPYDQLGYIYEDAAGIRVEEESGIDRKWLEAAAYGLADRIGPTVGKELSAAARKIGAQQHSRLCSGVATVPESDYAPGTPRGSGHRWPGATYFPASAD